MPSYLPESNTVYAQDGLRRSLQKINSRLVGLIGALPLTMYPEGTTPRPEDSAKRSLHKINTLVAALDTLIGTGSASALTPDTVEPEGVKVGPAKGVMYAQINGGGTIVRLWVFNGTIGANTGWI